jgi:large subunit ribosomal protein L19
MDKLDIVEQMNKQRITNARKEKDGEVFKEVIDFKPGDILDISVRVVEGTKERIQHFRGVVIARSGGKSPNATFTIRKISNGIGVERIFMLYSSNLQNIEMVKSGNVRRSKLYYLRGMSERKIKQKLA